MKKISKEQKLNSKELELKDSIKKLRASEKQLQAANQQLTAKEQQLRAANQQLTASEQQLRAANQQLTASEQQLRAANQQLKVESKKLRSSEKEISAIFNTAAGGMRVVGTDFKIKKVNHTFLKMVGLSEEEVIGRYCYDVFMGEYCHSESCPLTKLLEGKEERLEFEILKKRPDGKEIPTIKATTSLKDDDGNFIGIVEEYRDMSEYKKAQKELHEQYEQTRFWTEIAENARVGIAIGYPDGKMGASNKMYQEITGYSQKELLEINWNTVLTPPEWLQSELNELKKLHKTKKYVTYEKEYIRKNGKRIPVELTVHPGFNAKGEISYYYAFVHDISVRKKAEIEIKKSEARYRQLVETASDAIYMIDEEGTIIDTNKMAAKMLQRDIEDFIGKKINFIDPNFPVKDFVSFWSSVPFEEQRIFETTHKTKTGKLIPVEVSGNKFKIDDKIYFFGIARNITERKAAEEALKESEEKYRLLHENAGLGIGYYTPEGIVLSFNSVASDNLSGKPEDFTGKSIYDLFPKEAAEEYHNRFQKTLRSEEIFEYEDFVKLPEQDKWFLSTYTKVVNSHKKTLGVQIISQDITDRKKAEEALKESEERFRELVDTLNSGVAIYKVMNDGISGSDYIIQDFNQFALQHEKLEKEDVIGKSLKDIRPNIDEYGLIETFREVWKTGKPTFFPAKVYIDDKYSNYYENRVFKLPSGEIVAIYDDVTEREKSLIGLAESEAKFRSYVDCAPDGVFITDETGKYVEVNQAACDITGYSKDELTNMHISDTLQKSEIEKGIQHFKEVLESGSARGEIGFLTKSGENRFWEVAATKLSDTRFLGFVKDVTERRKAKEELESAKEKAELSEEYFRKAILTNPDAITINRLEDGVYVVANNGFNKIFGYTENEIIGTSSTSINIWNDANQRNEYKSLLETNGIIENFEAKFKTKSGEIKTCLVSASIILYEGQLHTINITKDITYLKEIESDLVSAKEKAEESDRLKSAFLANMSHEIRTPMNGILGFTDLLKNPQLSGEEQKRYIEIIDKSGQRMLNTIQDIIDISKIESGIEKISISEINLNKQMDELFDFFLPEAKIKNIQFSVNKQLPGDKVIIKSDNDKLNSILTNFIKNAIKYTHEGSIEFGYYLTNGTKEQELKIFVKDTGIGIQEDRQEAVFNRFEQADVEDRAAYQGSGLGLAIAKAYAEMLGGKISLESKPGVGSAFYFVLPFNSIVKKDKITNITPDMNQKISDRKFKFLIVEDEEDAVTYLKIILKNYAKEIFVTKSGLEAIKICKNIPDIDIILMDIKILEMNGCEATRNIREFNKNVFIIAQTAYAQKDDRKMCIEAGCNDYISKPINREELFRIIEKCQKIK